MTERNYIAERIGPLQWIVRDANATRVLFRSPSHAQAVRVASLLFNAFQDGAMAEQHKDDPPAETDQTELLMDFMG
jgi:hypothetical protein